MGYTTSNRTYVIVAVKSRNGMAEDAVVAEKELKSQQIVVTV